MSVYLSMLKRHLQSTYIIRGSKMTFQRSTEHVKSMKIAAMLPAARYRLF